MKDTNTIDAEFTKVDDNEKDSKKKSTFKFFFGSMKRAAITLLVGFAFYLFMFGGTVVDKVGYMVNDSYRIQLSDVNARFSRSWVLFGSPELIITSTQMNAVIDADGYMTAKIKDGQFKGDINDHVIWTPQFRKDIAQRYTIRGSGINGMVDVGIEDGETFINSCQLSIDINVWSE